MKIKLFLLAAAAASLLLAQRLQLNLDHLARRRPKWKTSTSTAT